MAEMEELIAFSEMTESLEKQIKSLSSLWFSVFSVSKTFWTFHLNVI